MIRIKLVAVLGVLALVLGACATAESGDAGTSSTTVTGDPLAIVVSTTIWGDIVAEIVGDHAQVETLFPIGGDPHDFVPSSSQVEAMQRADLVVVNGLHLEEGLEDEIDALKADGANVLDVAPLVDPIPYGEDDHAHEDEHDGDDEQGGHDHEDHEADHDDDDAHHDDEGHHHHHDGDDPHVWMDPLRVALAVEAIAAELAELQPEIDWMASAGPYVDSLRTLDDEVVALLDAVPASRRKMVTNHDAFGYFADRYGFEVVGAVIPSGSTLGAPSSADLAELVEIMIAESIDVIFAETIEPTTLADAVAAEVDSDVAVVELFTGSLGGPGSGAESYIGMIRTNATRISTALSG